MDKSTMRLWTLILTMTLLLTLVIFHGSAFGAPSFTLDKTFLNPTPAIGDRFGVSVVAVGADVLVGAYFDNTGATNAGAAYLFDGSTGALLQTFLNPTPNTDDEFGFSVAGVGTNVLVGAPKDNTGANDAGAAYLFDGSTGALLLTFLNPTPEAFDRFGWSVAGVGTNVLVGAPADNTGFESNAGKAYLFDGSTGALLLTFVNPTLEKNDNFGYSVAGMGTNVLVAAPFDNAGATSAGAAYLFDGSTGALLQTFLNPTPNTNDNFGYSVAGVGTNVLVGAYLDDAGATDAGAAYLFDGSTGALLLTFLNPTPFDGDLFGISVAAVGTDVLVAEQRDDTGGLNSGAVYRYDSNSGALLETILNPTPAVFDGFGHSISAVGTNIIVGAFFDDEGASDAGAAHLFKQIPNQPPTPPCQSGQAGGDLVSYWRAENNACDAADGNHGTPVGGTTFAAGKVGQAFSLDGANDYVSVPSTGVPVGGSPRTVKLWIKPDASSLAADLNNEVVPKN